MTSNSSTTPIKKLRLKSWDSVYRQKRMYFDSGRNYTLRHIDHRKVWRVSAYPFDGEMLRADGATRKEAIAKLRVEIAKRVMARVTGQ